MAGAEQERWDCAMNYLKKKIIKKYLANKLKSQLVTTVWKGCCSSWGSSGLTLQGEPVARASSAQAWGLLLACCQLEAGFFRDPVLLQGVLQQEHRKAAVRHRQDGRLLCAACNTPCSGTVSRTQSSWTRAAWQRKILGWLGLTAC